MCSPTGTHFCFSCAGLSKESFFSQVDAIFDGVNNKTNGLTNGKIVKTAQNLADDKPHLNFPLLKTAHNSQTSVESNSTSVSHEDAPLSNPLPPLIPPRTPITDDSHQLQHKKPVPPPRNILARSKHVSLSRDEPENNSIDLPEEIEEGAASRLCRRRLSSRVDCLYALAPPPGSPRSKHDNSAAGGFVFRANLDWSLQTSSDSEESDFESVNLPLNSTSKAPTEGTADRAGSPVSRSASKPTLSKAYNSEYVSITQEEAVVSSIEPLSPKYDKLIKKSSPIMTKRPVWFKRDSVPSNDKMTKRRSRSLDADLQRKVSVPVDQFRDRPVALSDSEDTTGGSDGYPKPFQHIRMRKRFLTSRQAATSSQDTLEKLFTLSPDWHRYDNDSDTEDVYYINPVEVGSRFTPKQSTVDSLGLTDAGTYLMLSQPELEKIKQDSPQRRIGVSVHSPLPIPVPDSRISDTRDTKKRSRRAGSKGTSDESFESGNESDYDDDDYECSNIYENLDNEEGSLVGKGRHAFRGSMNTDDTYARIDEVQNNLSSIPAYLIASSSKPSSINKAFPTVSTEQNRAGVFNTSDMLKDDGYARVGMGAREQAPLLPPRPPTFTRVRPSNQVRTVPGVREGVHVCMYVHY